MLLGTGRNLRPVQRLHIGRSEPQHEIVREAFSVAFDLFVQPLGGDAVECGEIDVEHHAPAAQDNDAAGNGFDRD